MFWIVFFKDEQPSNHFVSGHAFTLTEAREVRSFSGDIVVDSDGQIVKDETWLWEWEKDKPTCYAKEQMRRDIRIPIRLFHTPTRNSFDRDVIVWERWLPRNRIGA